MIVSISSTFSTSFSTIFSLNTHTPLFSEPSSAKPAAQKQSPEETLWTGEVMFWTGQDLHKVDPVSEEYVPA
jgi:hypothetical protein